MTLLKTLVSMGFVLATISQSVHAGFWDNNNLLKERTLSLKTDSLKTVLVDAGAGDMKIVGSPDSDTITVSAKIYGKKLDEEEYQLTLAQTDEQAVLYAHIIQQHGNGERIDLEITLPSNLKLAVRDRSGNIQIDAMQGGVSIDDNSGDIDLSNISGGLEIDDRSGNISATTVVGGITINDRSGNIILTTVVGDTKIRDKSGDIRIHTLSGNLDIEDSSGDISVKTVSGVVTVDDSSGNIEVDDAEDFVLLADGSGDVDLDNIRGR